MAVARLKRVALAAAAASLFCAPAAAQQKLDKVSFGTNWVAEAEHTAAITRRWSTAPIADTVST